MDIGMVQRAFSSVTGPGQSGNISRVPEETVFNTSDSVDVGLSSQNKAVENLPENIPPYKLHKDLKSYSNAMRSGQYRVGVEELKNLADGGSVTAGVVSGNVVGGVSGAVVGSVAGSDVIGDVETKGVRATFTNPIAPDGPGEAADPWVTFQDGKYHYIKVLPGNVLGVAQADRLQDIGKAPMQTVWTPPPGTEHSEHVWAPELHKIDNKWYIYYAASDANMDNHRMYVLESDSAQGPFEFKGKISDSTDKWAIDGTVLQHDNQMYFVWSGWEGDNNVRQCIYIAPMSDPCNISGPRVKISQPEHTWQTLGAPHVNEGPQVLTRNGRVHVIYSASGSWGEDYCLGRLTFSGGDILDPSNWVKNPSPVFSKAPGAYGPGHCSFTTSPDGAEDWIVYHACKDPGGAWGNRTTRAQKFSWDEFDNPVFGTPLPHGSEVEEPSGTPRKNSF